jgi:glyoxylase-like metal-dependent hydrolase (beta-lactamase superfamily II)/Flp pilus assembly protein TadD
MTIHVILVGAVVVSAALIADCQGAPGKTASEQGEESLKNENYDQAIKFFSEAIRTDPKNAKAYLLRGTAFLKKGDEEKALADFDESLRLDSDGAKSHSFRGLVDFVKGDENKAIASFTESIHRNPKNAAAYLFRGLVYGKHNDTEKAIADFSDCLRLRPNDAKAYYFRAVGYGTKKDVKKVIADLDASIRLDPKNAEAYQIRGLAYATGGDFDKAIADLDEALRLNPNDSGTQQQRALVLRVKGQLAGRAGKAKADADITAAKKRLASLPEQKLTQAPGFYRLMIGDVEVTALFDGIVDLDAALLANISEADRDALLKRAMIDDPHKIATSTNAYLINTGVKLVLVDAGGGTAFPGLGHLIENLKASGYKPEEVNAVVITHLHPDHVGGLIDAKGKPIFAKAVVYVAKAENDYWLAEAEPEVPTAYKEHLKKARKMVRDIAKPYLDSNRWRTFEEGKLPILRVKAVPIPGHTPGHTAYEVQSEGQTLVIVGDTVHVAAVQFPRPDAAVSFDSDQKQAVATREALFRRLADDKILVAGMHTPFPGIGRLHTDGKNVYTWVPIEYAPLPAAKPLSQEAAQKGKE